jgi:stringent starvation protein B
MSQIPPSKDAVVLKLLEEGDTMLCLDARREGVCVPPQHANDPALRLILNLNFPRPIDVTEEGISASLSFGGRRFACYIPMAALWAAFNPQTRQGMMWPESMPAEVARDLAGQQTGGPVAAAAPTSATPAEAGSESEPAAARPDTPQTPRQRGHLRVIK